MGLCLSRPPTCCCNRSQRTRYVSSQSIPLVEAFPADDGKWVNIMEELLPAVNFIEFVHARNRGVLVHCWKPSCGHMCECLLPCNPRLVVQHLLSPGSVFFEHLAAILVLARLGWMQQSAHDSSDVDDALQECPFEGHCASIGGPSRQCVHQQQFQAAVGAFGMHVAACPPVLVSAVSELASGCWCSSVPPLLMTLSSQSGIPTLDHGFVPLATDTVAFGRPQLPHHQLQYPNPNGA